MTPETTSPACCSCCANYDDDTRRCTATAGKLSGIILSDDLATADHDCPKYAEAHYRLTPAAILQGILEDYDCDLSITECKDIVEAFMAGMAKAGYIVDHDNDEE